MPPIKRLRIFAGPNGSGKSTFINHIKLNPPAPSFKLGYYVNADDIESGLKNKAPFNFKQFGLKISTEQIQAYFKKSTFAPKKLESPDLWKNFSVENNDLMIQKSLKINSYIAADIAEFIRQQLTKHNYSFSYETVMSDNKKILFLDYAKKAGYKIYLYYFATEDPKININKVKIRVAQFGHPVKSDVIKKRYYKSLENLKSAIKLSDRAYLFDSSQEAIVLVSEITAGKNVTVIDPENVPNWFEKYVVKS